MAGIEKLKEDSVEKRKEGSKIEKQMYCDICDIGKQKRRGSMESMKSRELF